MNRTDRLLAIVLELQGKGYQRVREYAHLCSSTGISSSAA